jgi:uncharacterized protein YggT (Ycf19 family)
MAYHSHVDTVRTTHQTADGGVQDWRRVDQTTDDTAYPLTIAQRIVYLLYGILAALLGLRILLSLLAANHANPFANFVYSVTAPFVYPFRSLFGVHTTIANTGARFEIESLVAILVYGLAAWALLRILDLPKRTEAE